MKKPDNIDDLQAAMGAQEESKTLTQAAREMAVAGQALTDAVGESIVPATEAAAKAIRDFDVAWRHTWAALPLAAKDEKDSRA